MKCWFCVRYMAVENFWLNQGFTCYLLHWSHNPSENKYKNIEEKLGTIETNEKYRTWNYFELFFRVCTLKLRTVVDLVIALHRDKQNKILRFIQKVSMRAYYAEWFKVQLQRTVPHFLFFFFDRLAKKYMFIRTLQGFIKFTVSKKVPLFLL